MQILRMLCSTDWKYRPHTRVVLIGMSHDQQSIASIIEADVQQWQAEELESSRELYNLRKEEGTLEEGETEPTVWANDDRWEIVRDNDVEVSSEDWIRAFVQCIEGDTTTTAYHTLME